jgi:hypothetical protein
MSFELFDSDQKVLAAYCWPMPDELMSSWLSRMAYDHGMATKDFCEAILPVSKSKFDIDRCVPEDCIDTLASHTNCDADMIRSTTLEHYIEKVFGSRGGGKVNWLMTSSCEGSRSSFSSRLMYCPICLQDKPYFRKRWRLAASFVCTDCGCYLIDSCPHCGQGNSFVDRDCENHLYCDIKQYMTICHHCGEDVTDCERVQAPDNVMQAQKIIYEVIENGPQNKDMVSSASYFKALYGLCRYLLLARSDTMASRTFITAAFNGAGVIKERIVLKYENFYIDKLSAIKRAGLLTVSTWLLEEWPHRFIKLCKNSNITSKEFQEYYIHPEPWFTNQVRRLTSEPIKKKYVPARIEQERYIIELEPTAGSRIDYDYDVDEYYYNDKRYGHKGEPEPVDWLGFIRLCYGEGARKRR